LLVGSLVEKWLEIKPSTKIIYIEPKKEAMPPETALMDMSSNVLSTISSMARTRMEQINASMPLSVCRYIRYFIY